MLSALVAIAVAAPHIQHQHEIIHQEVPYDVVAVEAAVPEYAQVGSIISSVPSAVSHQSRTDYHSTPIVKSLLANFEYVQPIVHQAPAVVHHESSPVVYTYAAAPAVQSRQVLQHSSPLVYSVQSSPQLILSSPQLYHSQPAVSSW